MQTKVEPQTLEEWKLYAKELKLRIRKLESRQADLIVKASQQTQIQESQLNERMISFSVTFWKKILLVQKIWRGYRARKQLEVNVNKYTKIQAN